jgi:uncharacterized protein
MKVVDDSIGARAFQAMVAMRDGNRLNTFVFLPGTSGPRWPVVLHRTPYGITAADASDKTDCTRAWLPSPEEPLRGSILRGWRNIVTHGYAAVYQDTRGRHGSEGEDRVYADDAADGHDTLDWIAGQPWSNGMAGMSGSSAGATTDLCRRLDAASDCARFSLRPVPQVFTMMSSMRASRLRWSGCGCG